MARVLFLHPDLGIGGAERLVVDAAIALKLHGHNVSFLTNHHNPNHCFKETNDSSFRVQVVGDWLPRNFFGRFNAFFAYIRMLYAACYVTFFLARRERIDIVFCDQISVCIPVLKIAKNKPRIIFYCHFPDQLLSSQEGILKRFYRAPLNYLEEYAMSKAHRTLVNSKFTLRVFRETFQSLNIVPEVLYPSINTIFFDDLERKFLECGGDPMLDNIPKNSFIFLDINRYERKKNHVLALYSFRMLGDMLPSIEFKRCRLLIAGGYDTRVVENVEHFEELQLLTRKLALQDYVVLLRSPSDEEKFKMLYAADCLLYTPENEHFGIVPLEGMYLHKAVIAMNSGGPTETIVNSSTGLLCERQPSSFGGAMFQLYSDDTLRLRMGEMGRKRVQQKFSFQAFGFKINNIIEDVLNETSDAKVTRTQK